MDNTSVFDRFCHMLSLLKSDAERMLVLTISRDFVYCSLAKHEDALHDILPKLPEHIPADAEELISVPLIKPQDIGKQKSGGFTNYLMVPYLSELARNRGLEFWPWDRPELLEERSAERSNATIIMIDDFLGSGRTVTDALAAYKTHWEKASDSVIVVALVAQEEAVLAVQELGIPCIVSQIRKRGISDSMRLSDPLVALALMDKIEKRIKVGSSFRRGFAQSEALVSMTRCPNNTFPVYWTTKSVSGKAWPAPFRR